MIKKKTSIILGTILLLIAVILVGVAVSHPEFSFPWSLRITYMLYGLYVWLLFRFLLVIPVFQHMKGATSNRKYCQSDYIYAYGYRVFYNGDYRR